MRTLSVMPTIPPHQAIELHDSMLLAVRVVDADVVLTEQRRGDYSPSARLESYGLLDRLEAQGVRRFDRATEMPMRGGDQRITIVLVPVQAEAPRLDG